MHHQLRYLIPCFPQSSAIYDTKNKVPFSKDKEYAAKIRSIQQKQGIRSTPISAEMSQPRKTKQLKQPKQLKANRSLQNTSQPTANRKIRCIFVAHFLKTI